MKCSGSKVRCADGSCSSSKEKCPDNFLCFEPIPDKCSDGSCAAKGACPARVTCLPGFVKCESGVCRKSLEECTEATTKCTLAQVRCPDGTCRDNMYMCPTGKWCPLEAAVLCPDGACVADVSLCKSNFCEGKICPDGSCARNGMCGTVVTCPFPKNIKCHDGSCVANTGECPVPRSCPVKRCPDGRCVVHMEQCSTPFSCPDVAPLRCPMGGCVVDPIQCMGAEQTESYNNDNRVQCPGGERALHVSLCPTHVSCPTGQPRCYDGTCSKSCTGPRLLQYDENAGSSDACNADEFVCPRGFAGLACASKLSDCPQATTCPPDTPVRCQDYTCAYSQMDCPPKYDGDNGLFACPDGGFATALSDCGKATTCPPWKVKCWDSTCRHLPEDCPPNNFCTEEVIRPFQCNDGSCVGSLSGCVTFSMKSDKRGSVLCPYAVKNGLASQPVYNETAENCNAKDVSMVCPNRATRCMDGSCRRSPIFCKPLKCPLFLPYQCPSGKCVREKLECDLPNGCPANRKHKCDTSGACVEDQSKCDDFKCAGNSTRCRDGSCIPQGVDCTSGGKLIEENGCPRGQIMCKSGVCMDVRGKLNGCIGMDERGGSRPSTANLCPLEIPYKCPNGFCARSSATCPVYPEPIDKRCASDYPVRCDDGSCAKSAIQCPHMFPCPKDTIRCRGSCIDNMRTCAASITSCPSFRSHRCDNGVCVSEKELCPDHNSEGCPTDYRKCEDGHCVNNTATCPKRSTKSGECWEDAMKQKEKCPDGSCKKPCKKANKVFFDDPYTGDNLSINNCPIASPIRCANGECKKFPFEGNVMDSDACQPTPSCGDGKVLCADGNCAVKDMCRPVLCKNPAEVYCPHTGVCGGPCVMFHLVCPSNAPVVCPSGLCVRTLAECPVRMQTGACATTEIQCYDGSCVKSPLECMIRTAKKNNAEDVSSACGEGENAGLCWDGTCRKNIANCPAVQRCPDVRPLACADGSCTNTTCQFKKTLSNIDGFDFPTADNQACSTNSRCEDGSCRKVCPPALGCPLTLPYHCVHRGPTCAKDKATCMRFGIHSCGTDCERDGVAQLQHAPLQPLREVKLHVAFKGPNSRTTLRLGSGAVKKAMNLTIIPVSPISMSERLLSAPFKCVSDQPDGFALPAVVDAAVDHYLYSGGVEEEAVGVPCEFTNQYRIFKNWTDEVKERLGREGICPGIIEITQDTISWVFPKEGNVCPSDEFSGTLIPSETFQMDGADKGTTCACFSSPAGDKCLKLKLISNKLPREIRLVDGTAGKGAKCEFGNDKTDLDLYADSFDDQCLARQDAGVEIPRKDICFASSKDGGKNWECVAERADRIDSKKFVSDYGPPLSWRSGTLPVHKDGDGCVANKIWAFARVALPPPQPIFKDFFNWWAEYGTSTVWLIVGLFLFFAATIYVLWRFTRYRKKYKAEKHQLNELMDKAVELDEFGGGLGVADTDGDVDMVANPMVIQLQQLQHRMDRVKEEMGVQAELDQVEVDRLESDRLRIHAEMERLQKMLNEQAKAKRAVRERNSMDDVNAARTSRPMGSSTNLTTSPAQNESARSLTTAKKKEKKAFKAKPQKRKKKNL